MAGERPRIHAACLDGSEEFRLASGPAGFSVLDFWRWSASHLLSNATRGILAEFLVAKALGVGVDVPRDEWAAYDLQTRDGIKVEVKSSAYLQSWAQKTESNIVFSIRKAREWSPDTGAMAAEPSRSADVYVFALLAHRHKATVAPLDLSQWVFYVLPRDALDARSRSQVSVTLGTLDRMTNGPLRFEELAAAVRAIGTKQA